MFRNREDFELDRPPRMRLEQEIAAMEHEKRTAIVSFHFKKINGSKNIIQNRVGNKLWLLLAQVDDQKLEGEPTLVQLTGLGKFIQILNIFKYVSNYDTYVSIFSF